MAQTAKRILVTGGAGFIGSHLVDALVARGHQVRILDRLEEQVHGPDSQKPGFRPDYLNPDVELIAGDVADRALLEKALDGVQVVYHQAAAVGVGQSQYEIEKYVARNTGATAVLLDVLANNRDKYPLERFVVASSMSIYGEGRYRAKSGELFAPRLRPDAQLEAHEWEMRGPDGEVAEPAPTDEEKPLYCTSVYALSKKDQEEYCLVVGNSYGIPTVALRYFNVYGPRQALSNPYTGVAAIFGSRLLNDKAPIIFEDGRQTRDFVHVSDIVQGNLLAMEAPAGDVAGQVFNIGTGRPLNLLEVFGILADGLGKGHITPQIAGKYRSGDIRHCVADISKAKRVLGYEPKTRFEDGMKELSAWMSTQTAEDRVEQAAAELAKKGLAR
jgi:dTDP-L-rhamnose 4-epimerase